MDARLSECRDRLRSVDTGQPQTGRTVYYDITDLLSFLGKSPIVTGIQRVQMEAILALRDGTQDSAIENCQCAIFGSDFVWRAVPVSEFHDLFGRTDISDAAWQKEVSDFADALMGTEDVVFAPGDTVYFLGATWGVPGLFESLRDPRLDEVRFVFYLHDIIPVKFPEYSTQATEVLFSYWTFNVSVVAAAVICNSEATRTDFLEVTGYDRPTSVVNLNIRPNFSLPDKKEISETFLEDNGLSDQAYVLMVGTVEPRKNHIAIVNVWTSLKRRLGQKCPRLVIVGRVGWNAAGICQHIEMMNRSNDILHLQSVRDTELAQLYAQCSFTIYASRYEGWGLPVTESLSFGKVCASGSNSSLAEAGQGLTVLMNELSESDMAESLYYLIETPAFLRQEEERIRLKASFKTWREFGDEVRAIEAELQAKAENSVPPIDPGTSYWFGRGRWSNAFAGHMPGELLRTGRGWRPAEDWGSWCTSPESAIEFGMTLAGDYDCFVLVSAPPGGAKLRLVHKHHTIWEGLVIKQKLVWGRLGQVAASEKVRLEVHCDELAEPARWLIPPAAPPFGAGWIAMRVEHHDAGTSGSNTHHRTLGVLTEFLSSHTAD